jgi:cellulose synthase/poly-beta-1,6-N-acetylglucosamine synthase-like glycosyltransferase
MIDLNLILSVFFIAMILLYTSWLMLIYLPKREKEYPENYSAPLSIIVPAHNEENMIRETINALIDAEYCGTKEIIVVNDGSTDNTERILKEAASKENNVRYINTDHVGKAGAINAGLRIAGGDIILTLDADSKVERSAIKRITAPFSDKDTGAVSGIIGCIISNRNILTWFQDFEYVLSSGWRYALNRVNSTYIFPGFAAYRKEALNAIGGFNKDTLAEDFDVGIRLKKAGYGLTMSRALIYTKVPETLRGLLRQRMRWGRGTVQVMKKHSDVLFNKKYGIMSLYAIPSQMYWYVHGFIVVPITFYQIFDGYFKYFVANNNILSWDVLKYFFNWFTAYGMYDYTQKALTGEYTFTTVFLLAMAVFLLGLIYNLAIISKISRMRLRYIFVMFFFFPYSVLMLTAYTIPSIIDMLPMKLKKTNAWEKSE